LDIKPSFVFHLAAQALVYQSYENPLETWETNVLGTINVLESLRRLNNLCIAIFITSDKCYNNTEKDQGYLETDELGGSDPYSASKGAAEFAIRSYTKSYFPIEKTNVRIASARAGNVIGGGDWSADRIIPDCVKSWSENNTVKLRNPNSVRPWQHVLEPLSGYLTLALALKNNVNFHGEAFNFGPSLQENLSVLELVKEMSVYWDKVKWSYASGLINNYHEANLLKLDCNKALNLLSWHAAMNFKDTVRMTAEWYKLFYSNPEKVIDMTNSQIDQYLKIANVSGLKWAQ